MDKSNHKDHPKILPKRIASSHLDVKVINFIFVGFDICRTSYSIVKRNAKASKIEKKENPWKKAFLTDKKEILLDEDDRKHVLDPHHDGLVITFYVSNHFIFDEVLL